MNPGTKVVVVPPPDIQIHVKGLSLGAELKDYDGRTSLKLSYELVTSPTDDDDEEQTEDEKEAPTDTKEVVLGSLTPGKVGNIVPSLGSLITLLSLPQIEQTAVDLVLDQEDEYVFEVIGKKW